MAPSSTRAATRTTTAAPAMAPPPPPPTINASTPTKKSSGSKAPAPVTQGPPTAAQFLLRVEAKNTDNPFRDAVPSLPSPAAQQVTGSQCSPPPPPAHALPQQQQHASEGNTSPKLFDTVRQEVGVDCGGEVKPVAHNTRPRRKMKATKKKRESMQDDNGDVVKKIPLLDRRSVHASNEASAVIRTPLLSSIEGVQTRRQMRLKKQPLKEDGNPGPSPLSLEQPSPRLSRAPPNVVADAVVAGNRNGCADLPMGRRNGTDCAFVITPGGTISQDFELKESVNLRDEPPQEVITASAEPGKPSMFGANAETALEIRSSSLKGEAGNVAGSDYDYDGQDQHIVYDNWDNEDDVHLQGAYETPNWRIHNHSPTKEHRGRHHRAPTPFHRRASPEPEASQYRRRNPSIFPSARPSTKRKTAHPSKEDDEKHKRQCLSDTRHSLTLLSQAVHHLSLIQAQFLPLPLAKNDLGTLYSRLQADECLTHYGKAVLTRKMGEEGCWREAREYISLEGERKREVRRAWWSLAFPQGLEEGWFVEGVVDGSPTSPEVVADDHLEEGQ